VYSNWCKNRPEKLHLKGASGTSIYTERKCPAGKARCGHFNDYVCKCDAKNECSRWGWCGQGGL